MSPTVRPKSPDAPPFFFSSFLQVQQIVEALVQLLRNTIAQTDTPLKDVKAVYWGDPVKIPLSSMPALIVHPVSSEYFRRGTRYDQKLHSVEIRLVYNISQYVKVTPDDAFKVESVAQSFSAIESTVKGTMSTQLESLCGIIQAHPSLTYLDGEGVTQAASVDSKVRRVNYVFNGARGFPTYEVITTIETRAVGDRATN